MPLLGSTSTHGNHWSFPAPESAAFTRVGELQLEPPSVDVTRNTSVFVTGLATSCTPLRLSKNTKYRRPLCVGSATRFPVIGVRTW